MIMQRKPFFAHDASNYADVYEVLWCSPSGHAGRCDFPPGIDLCVRLSHLLVCVNSTVNCAFYYLPGKVFRKAWKETYGCCFRLPRAVSASFTRRITARRSSSRQQQQRASSGVNEQLKRPSHLPLQKGIYAITEL